MSWTEWENYFPGQPYRKICPDLRIHESVQQAAQNYARAGDRTRAEVLFERIAVLEPELALRPEIETQRYLAQGHIARQELDDAMRLLHELQANDTTLDLHVERADLFAIARQYWRKDNYTGANTLLGQIESLEPKREVSADRWNELCWFGALHNHPKEVLSACEHAVELDPQNGGIRDSRGVARALTADRSGAAAEFLAFVDWAKGQSRYAEEQKQRQAWVDALQQGKDPIDTSTLNMLREQG